MKRNKIFLEHILEEINFLLKVSQNLSFNQFMEDEVLKRACSRSIEIIGEAVKNLPDDFRNEYPNVEWKKIAGLRDKVIHFYFGVNWDIIWDVIIKKLPKLKQNIEEIILKLPD